MYFKCVFLSFYSNQMWPENLDSTTCHHILFFMTILSYCLHFSPPFLSVHFLFPFPGVYVLLSVATCCHLLTCSTRSTATRERSGSWSTTTEWDLPTKRKSSRFQTRFSNSLDCCMHCHKGSHECDADCSVYAWNLLKLFIKSMLFPWHAVTWVVHLFQLHSVLLLVSVLFVAGTQNWAIWTLHMGTPTYHLVCCINKFVI